MIKIINVNDNNFNKEVISNKGIVVVDCWATRSEVCRFNAPVVYETANAYKSIKFVKLNIEENPYTVSNNNIKMAPCVIIYKKGNIEEIILGVTDRKYLAQKIGQANNIVRK